MGGIWVIESIGVGWEPTMGLMAMGDGKGLPKRGLPAPHRWGTIFKGRG